MRPQPGTPGLVLPQEHLPALPGHRRQHRSRLLHLLLGLATPTALQAGSWGKDPPLEPLLGALPHPFQAAEFQLPEPGSNKLPSFQETKVETCVSGVPGNTRSLQHLCSRQESGKVPVKWAELKQRGL